MVAYIIDVFILGISKYLFILFVFNILKDATVTINKEFFNAFIGFGGALFGLISNWLYFTFFENSFG